MYKIYLWGGSKFFELLIQSPSLKADDFSERAEMLRMVGGGAGCLLPCWMAFQWLPAEYLRPNS
jgi:hypothetical protein